MLRDLKLSCTSQIPHPLLPDACFWSWVVGGATSLNGKDVANIFFQIKQNSRHPGELSNVFPENQRSWTYAQCRHVSVLVFLWFKKSQCNIRTYNLNKYRVCPSYRSEVNKNNVRNLIVL